LRARVGLLRRKAREGVRRQSDPHAPNFLARATDHHDERPAPMGLKANIGSGCGCIGSRCDNTWRTRRRARFRVKREED